MNIIKMKMKSNRKVGANWVYPEKHIERLPDRKQLIKGGIKLGLFYYEGRWIERIKVTDTVFVDKESTQEYLNKGNILAITCTVYADWFDKKKES